MSKLFVNIDSDDCGGRFLNRLTNEREYIEKSDLYPFVDQYADEGVTDLLICLGGQYSFPESRVLSDSVFKYEQREENGFAVDYREKFVGVYKMYKVHGIDPVKVWVDRCREVGMTPWLSFRMNDRHCSRDDTSDQRPTLFYEAKKNGWMLGERYGAFKTCMNFAVDEIRDVWLRYIDEQLSKYDAWGIELDFQREMYCLDHLGTPDCHEIMTGFVRDVRRVIDRHAAHKGHPVRLACRLMRDIDQCLVFGFDARTWDKERLADAITVAPRWECCDSDMPVRKWKESLPNTEIYAGLETLIRFDGALYHATAETLRGYVNRYLSDGADGTYLFNYYPVPGDGTEYGKRHLKRCIEVFRTCRDKRTADSYPMRYIVTRQDVSPEGHEAYKPLPIAVNGGERSLLVDVGRLEKCHKVGLIIGLDGVSPQDLRICVNGRKLSDPVAYMPRPEEFSTDDGCGYVPNGTRTFRYDVMTETEGEYRIAFNGQRGSITYIEFEIDPSREAE